MKINPRYIKLSAAVVASLISACSIEVETPTDEKGVPSYTNKLSELYEIECNAERAGSKVFVNFEQMTFECDGTQWNGAYAGQIYKTIKIGNQNWLAQNLNYNTVDSWCFDATTNCAKDGRYYSWYGAMNLVEDDWVNSFDTIEPEHQGACPAGWDVYGFALTPSGYFDRVLDFEVTQKTTSIYQWTATPGTGTRTHSRYFEMSEDMILIGPSYDNKSGMSVRCIENSGDQAPVENNPIDQPIDEPINTDPLITNPIDEPIDTPVDTPIQTTEPTGPTGDVISCNMEISIMGITTSSCDEYAAGSATAEAAIAQCVSVEGYLTATLGNGCPANYTKKCVVSDEAIVYFYEEENANQDCSDLITTK